MGQAPRGQMQTLLVHPPQRKRSKPIKSGVAAPVRRRNPAFYWHILLPSGSPSPLGHLHSRASPLLRANSRRLRAPRSRGRRTPHNPDESEKHRPVANGRHHQENKTRITSQAQAIHHQENQTRQQDVEQGDRDQDQPGKLHQLVGAQTWQRAAHPDEDKAPR